MNGCSFFEEIPFSDNELKLENLNGNVEYLNRTNDLYIYGENESELSKNKIQKIIINKNNFYINAIYIKNHNLEEICIKNKLYKIKKNAKLILLDKLEEFNFEIILKKIKKNEKFKKLGTLIFLKKIGELEQLPNDFSYKLDTIGNFFQKSKGGSVKVIYGIKAKYKLDFIGASYNDISLLKKLYFYNKYFYMSIFPDNEDIQEEGLKIEDFLPLIITGDFFPKIRNNILGIGQDITINLEEI